MRTTFPRSALAALALALFSILACSAVLAAPPPSAEFAVVAEAQATSPLEYKIGALDKLSITVFQVKDLTLEGVRVDASGRMILPLIGTVVAKGKTTQEIAYEIAARLGEKYLQNPQVSVVVAESASQKVTVEGAVTSAGVFELKGRTTLLQAVAMAKGPSKVADLSKVAIFRQVDGRRMAARFDLRAIRAGRLEDPEVLGDDVVVIADSGFRSIFSNLVSALPALGVFAFF